PRAAPATGAFTLGPATKAPAAVRGPAGGDAYVQVGAFADLGNAKTLESRLKSIGPTVVMPVTMGDHVLYR
ncbi:MAG TPA: septal ring lytic transglycosylase RlpA family protein, partial [Rhodospirillum rubrum]|nr:septal ring lytic transglycosylase RlpA family protein [Rhodospirillum rubrum]